jgi:hypothetical protein
VTHRVDHAAIVLGFAVGTIAAVLGAAPSARVVQVYPSGDVLPSNQLRLYIYFSAPMSRGEAERHIHVLDRQGQVLPGIFLPGEELWDPNQQRLTMTFDPGRIKRGLTSNSAMGPPIAEGALYTLVIDRDWPDAAGAPLADEFRKPFRGGPAVRTAPDPKRWRVTAPPPGSSDPLVVDFPRPMNYVLLLRMIRVSAGSVEVSGAAAVDRHETQWRFTPHQAWAPGTYQLVVDTVLEDLAGNHIGQLFDIDVSINRRQQVNSPTIEIPFQVRSAQQSDSRSERSPH